MAKRRSVLHVESGKVFPTAAAAEREFGFPESVLSEAIRLGKSYRGQLFKFVDEAPASISTDPKVKLDPESSSPLSGGLDDAVDKISEVLSNSPDVSIKLSDSDIRSMLSMFSNTLETVDPVYDGSPTDKEAAVKYFQSKGIDVDLVDGVVAFYGYSLPTVQELVMKSGYRSSWGCYPKTRKRTSNTSVKYNRQVDE